MTTLNTQKENLYQADIRYQDAISYELLAAEHVNNTIDLICKDFRENEPITHFLNVPDEEFKPYVQDLIAHACRSRLSWIAKDVKTGDIVGTRIVTDCQSDFSPQISYGPKMDIIFDFLTHVSQYNDYLVVPIRAGKMHAHIVSVSGNYRRMKIASNLFWHATNWGKRHGYSLLTGEITSHYNKKILQSFLGFQRLNEVHYNKYVANGTKPLADIPMPHESCVAYIIDLQNPNALTTRDSYAAK
jgi:hypothetical protein